MVHLRRLWRVVREKRAFKPSKSPSITKLMTWHFNLFRCIKTRVIGNQASSQTSSPSSLHTISFQIQSKLHRPNSINLRLSMPHDRTPRIYSRASRVSWMLTILWSKFPRLTNSLQMIRFRYSPHSSSSNLGLRLCVRLILAIHSSLRLKTCRITCLTSVIWFPQHRRSTSRWSLLINKKLFNSLSSKICKWPTQCRTKPTTVKV